MKELANKREMMGLALENTYWRGLGDLQAVLLEFVIRDKQAAYARYDLEKRNMDGPFEYCLHGGSTHLPAVELTCRAKRYHRWDHQAWIYINKDEELVVSRGLTVQVFEKIEKRLFIDLLVETWWHETAPTLT